MGGRKREDGREAEVMYFLDTGRILVIAYLSLTSVTTSAAL